MTRLLLSHPFPRALQILISDSLMIRYAVMFIAGFLSAYLYASVRFRIKQEEMQKLRMECDRLTSLTSNVVALIDRFETRAKNMRRATTGNQPQ